MAGQTMAELRAQLFPAGSGAPDPGAPGWTSTVSGIDYGAMTAGVRGELVAHALPAGVVLLVVVMAVRTGVRITRTLAEVKKADRAGPRYS